jgi:hypothetical protein
MTTSSTIPLLGVNESFTITLGLPYTFTIIWRDDPCGMGGWFLDIGDGANNPLVQGIAMVAGHDLLEQFGYLGFSGQLWMQTAQDPTADPTFDNLGTDCQMYWVTEP